MSKPTKGTADLFQYIDMLATLTAGQEPYHVDLKLGIVTTKYQTWNIVVSDEVLKYIKLEEV